MNEDDILFGKPRRDLDEPKELKIKLPLRYHVRLHSLKLLRKQNIAESVMRALDDYFSRNAPVRQAPPVESPPHTPTADEEDVPSFPRGRPGIASFNADESHATG